ncbi:MAG: hypothetical protein K6E93_01865 [Bacteroidales bacterium]|jgi:hypothetical protein|nr:hypothetical protein [Bacteroidales bacterium]
MKKVFSILMVAFALTAMVACSEKDNGAGNGGGNNNGGNGGSSLNIPNNTVVYDGQTYTFDDVVVDYYHSELTLVSAYTDDTLANGDPVLAIEGIHINPNAWNCNIDLANPAHWPQEVLVGLHMRGSIQISFEAWANDGVLGGGGTLDGVQYDNESIFSSGTYRVSGNNDGTPITITYDGMLKNGKRIQIKIVSDNYQTGYGD